MTMNDKIADYITFPKTFENYRWYKPIPVLIVSLILMTILTVVLTAVFYILEPSIIESVFKEGYEAFTSPVAIFFTDLLLIIFIPSLYIASKVVKDRPFSSYSSSRGGWNYKLYFKALVIPLILCIMDLAIETAITGPESTSHFSMAFIIVLLISVPLQCIAEEYIFRGFIMQTLGAWLKIPILVIALQAIIFALGHGYNSIGLFDTWVTGLVFGFFTWKTNGIEVSSALHTANNFSFGLFVMLGLQASTSSPQLFEIAFSIVFSIILFVIMYYIGKKTDWFGEIPEDSQNKELFNHE